MRVTRPNLPPVPRPGFDAPRLQSGAAPSAALAVAPILALVLAAIAGLPGTVLAQSAGPDRAVASEASATRFELRPFVGGMGGTGAHNDLLRPGALFGLQVGVPVTRYVAVAGTFGWAPTKDRTTARRPRAGTTGGLFTGRQETLDVFRYDLGIEGRLPDAVGRATWGLSPFIGVGGGGVSYRYRDVDGAQARHTPAGYAALGTDVRFARQRIGVRVEGRSTFSRFRGLRGEVREATTRHQLSLAAGLTVGF